MNQSAHPTVTKIAQSPWHWKSLIIYIAALVCVVDAPLQYIIFQDVWGMITSVILAIFLAIESYGRIAVSQTYLGKTFAPVLAGLIIGLICATYAMYFAIG